MTTYQTSTIAYLPIPDAVAAEARRNMRDAFGHALRVERNQAPCRSCLRIGTQPEDLILLSYQPLDDASPYAEVGPIFIHAHACAPYAQTGTFPADFAERELVLRAYTRTGRIAGAAVAAGVRAPDVAARFLSDDDVAEVHVRHRSYTCFAFRIVRA